MKTAIAFSLFAICGAAQTLSLSGSGAAPGKTVTVALTLSGIGTIQPAALQWTISGISGATVTPGVAAGTSGKNVSCNPSLTCVSSGVNGNLYQPGVVAIITFLAPTTPAPLTVSLANVLGASLAGDAVVVTAGPPLTIPVALPSSSCDANGDGKIDTNDVDLFVSAAKVSIVSPAACTPAFDLNGDGKCDVVDVQRVSLAAMAPTAGTPGSGICRTGQ